MHSLSPTIKYRPLSAYGTKLNKKQYFVGQIRTHYYITSQDNTANNTCYEHLMGGIHERTIK